jgi:hypothetical protein
MTLSIKHLYVTLSKMTLDINDTQHKALICDTQHK